MKRADKFLANYEKSKNTDLEDDNEDDGASKKKKGKISFYGSAINLLTV